MALRQQLKRTLERLVGPERTKVVWRAERQFRRNLAQRLEPSGSAVPGEPTPKGPVKTPIMSSPASGPSVGRKSPGQLAAPPEGGYRPNAPFADFPAASLSRHELLRFLHDALQPRTYLETGVASGASLALSRAKSIGVDPSFGVVSELHCDLHLIREGSDEFFARPDAVAHFEGVPVDLAFIDGMHLSEFALRDFMNIERLMAPTGVILIDDMLPRNALEAARDRQTLEWTGDVYKLLLFLREQRPDLTVLPVNTRPTGTVLVLGVDPTSEVLRVNYEDNLARCDTQDPQIVPDDILHRTSAVDPDAIVTSDVWGDLLALRSQSADQAAVRTVARRLTQLTEVGVF